MAKSKPQFDHAVINVEDDLDAAVALFTRFGFHFTDRGHHSHGSSNHLAVFGDTFLELLGYEQGRMTPETYHWKHPRGLTALVFKTFDAASLHRDLKQRGVGVEDLRGFHRPIRLPDGSTDEAHFQIVRLAIDSVPNGRTFFCHHQTPSLVYRDEFRNHPNGAIELTEFVIATREPDRTASLYEKIFGLETVSDTPGGRELAADKTKVLFLAPDEVTRRFGKTTLEQPDGTDRMVALTMKTRSLAKAKSVLDSNKVRYTNGPGNRVIIPASEAVGAALAFAE